MNGIDRSDRVETATVVILVIVATAFIIALALS